MVRNSRCRQVRPVGQCTVTATVDTLTLRVEATDEDGLERIQDIITRNFNRFGRREHLTVDWQRPETPSVAFDTGRRRVAVTGITHSVVSRNVTSAP
jgi:uncharacterized protein DUF2218